MATPRRPGRPGARPASGAAARRRRAEEEIPEGEEGFDEDVPPPPQGPSTTMLVGLGAALLFAGLLGYLMLSKRKFHVEVENVSDNPIYKVVVKINGQAYDLGDMRPTSISGANGSCTPGNDIEVTYTVPNRGDFVRKLPKTDKNGQPLTFDFEHYTGSCRLRLNPEGIEQFIWYD